MNESKVSEKLPFAEKISWYDYDHEEYPAYEGKYLYEVFTFSGIFSDIDTVVDDRGKGSYERAEAGCVGAVYESGKILREGIEYY